MNILIIENVWMGGAKYALFEKTLLTSFSILPTLNARQLAAITPKKHIVTVLTERYSKIDFEKNYDIVNINYTTSTTKRAYEIAKEFKKRGVTVVLSGFQASALPEEAKKYADSVLIGKGELNWLKLLDDFENNNLKPYYQPIKYDKSISIPPTNINLPGFVITGAIEATRGCPYKCEFCPESNIAGGSEFYTRPVDDVIKEIISIPQKTLMFYDTSLTINPKYTKELFYKMKGLNKNFFCNGNSNILANDEEFVKLSKDAGCVSWLIGFESFSQKTIDSVGKYTNKIEEYFKAVKNIHKNHMAVIGDFMFGFDTDTIDVFDDTLKMIKELNIDIADFCVLTPFPGTPIYNKLEREGRILTKDWSKYNLKTVVFKPKNLTPDELRQGIIKMYSEFYTPIYTLKRVLRSLNFGIYPFFMVLARNTISNMNRRILFFSKD
jgi:radical SAM superfamily enzyme YgiQ (UPF0313 family)